MTPLLIPAGNASEWTGPTGNNTWLLSGRHPALIDTGAGVPDYVDRVARSLAGAPLARILITHGHPDHVGGLAALRERWPEVRVTPPTGPTGRVAAGDGELHVIPTPGHSPDHLCFFDDHSGDLYCGDMARAGGTIVIPIDEGGNLRDYLASLERMLALAPARLLPGHGPIVDDPAALIESYIAHRHRRTEQIDTLVKHGTRNVEELVDAIYPGISNRLRRAARDTVRAHLAYLDLTPEG
jgi:glyoxylase-like metal-dependent hydrolase (beta-lactamase superfamily II)